MVQVSFPGVYIREVPSGVRTITGVATAIAAFVGEAKRGQMFEPTRVLGFTDYERLFSADTTLGEMTDQVRQFFLNGGQQAFIVRIAAGEGEAAITLDAADGTTPVLRLIAKSAGLDGNSLRASVDYNTSSPERTFNLRVYREVFNDSGVPQVLDEELFTDLTMDANSSRSAKTILDQQSVLVNAAYGTVTAGTAISASARLFAALTDANTALEDAIEDTAPGDGGTTGMFRIKIGAEPFRTVSVSLTAAQTDGIEALEAAINALGTNVVVSHAANGPIVITAGGTGVDLVIERSPDRDIAVALGLGVAQGGVEVGAFAAARPAPSAYASVIGGTALANLLDFATTPKAELATVSMSTPRSFGPLPVTFPAGGTVMADPTTGTGRSLRNVAARLSNIADAINAGTTDWRAEVHGYRLVLIPRFGDANAGTGHTVSSGPTYDLSAAGNLFAGVTANVAAYSLGTSGSGIFQSSPAAGNDGTVPGLGDYEDAFEAIDEKVDLFNIMVLPRSNPTRDVANIRASVWGPASAFCQRKRAFLIVDAGPTAVGVDEVLEGRADLRTGVVKDHAAVYWPPIKIPVNGTTKNIDPSGTIAGLMARIDSNRGVWKAPAGLEADLRGVRGVAVPMSDAQNGLLNPEAINAIRAFPNGIVSWGARTMDGFDNSGNNDYKYVPVRRFALFIEESLYRGLKFAVFEPNDEPLWAQIRLAVGAFMNNLFRQGAFAGKTARDSYFVKVDAETTTQNDINLGIVNVVVGFAPLKPAEFIVVTIKQQAGQVQV